MNIGQMREMAKKKFKDHKATIILHDDNFFIVDWRRSDGSGEYAVRYILDIQKGNFIVTGDLGDSIASWYNPVSPKNLKLYLDDILYYIGKLQCSSDLYCYRNEDIIRDLEDLKEEYIEFSMTMDEEEVNTDFEEMKEILLDLPLPCTYPEELTDLMQKYEEDWFDSNFAGIGRRVSPRVVLWAVGYQMACERLFM